MVNLLFHCWNKRFGPTIGLHFLLLNTALSVRHSPTYLLQALPSSSMQSNVTVNNKSLFLCHTFSLFNPLQLLLPKQVRNVKIRITSFLPLSLVNIVVHMHKKRHRSSHVTRLSLSLSLFDANLSAYLNLTRCVYLQISHLGRSVGMFKFEYFSSFRVHASGMYEMFIILKWVLSKPNC